MDQGMILTATTVRTLDPDQPEADAIAVQGGTIVAVGDERTCQAALPDATVEAFEGTLLPGLTDAHTHMGRLPQRALIVDLSSASTLEEGLAMLGRATRDPVVAYGWDESRWGGEALTPDVLDEALPGRAVLAMRVCGHHAVASPTLAEREGLDTMLYEDPVMAAWERLAPTALEASKVAEETWAGLFRQGVVAVTDMVDRGALDTYWAARVPRPTVHAYATPKVLNVVPRSLDGFVNAGVKLYADGSIGARTARLRGPWRYDDEGQGELLVDANKVRHWGEHCRRKRRQLAVHAIGNGALAEVLDGFSQVEHARPPRVEHVEIADQDQIERMADLGVVASIQPNFIGEWGQPGGMYEDRLGPEFVTEHNRFRDLADADVPLILGTDGMPQDLLYSWQWALQGPSPRQRLTPTEALEAVTRTPAEVMGREGGVLRKGRPADVCVMDIDPVRRPDAIAEAKVLLTVQGGVVRHRA